MTEQISDKGHFLTVLHVPKMDCPSEEQIVRMALEGRSCVYKVTVDLKARKVHVVHKGAKEELLSYLSALNLGTYIDASQKLEIDKLSNNSQPEKSESKVLKVLLLINAVMFLVELLIGWVAQSAGLISDSLDMLADSLVYGISLYAVGRALIQKQKAARLSGYFQIVLAFGAFTEVGRRFFFENEPVGTLMVGMACLAFLANISCLILLSKHRAGEVHMKASWIFSTNDVLANLGVIVAGLLVTFTSSKLPDLIIGLVIAAVVLSGGVRILRLSKVS
jgi:Co/Zn/Cd efflux system component